MVLIFNEEVAGYQLCVDEPTNDSENWTTIKQRSFTLDKGEFILEAYNKDFPKNPISDYDVFKKIVSRSERLSEWYSKTSLLFSDSIQLPVAFKDAFTPEEYKKKFSDLQEYKSNLSSETEEVSALADKFRIDRLKIETKYKKLNKVIIDKDKTYSIMTLSKNKLPISAQILIEGYTPKTDDKFDTQSTYAQEILINYQKALLLLVKNNKDVDIDIVIDEMRSK